MAVATVSRPEMGSPRKWFMYSAKVKPGISYGGRLRSDNAKALQSKVSKDFLSSVRGLSKKNRARLGSARRNSTVGRGHYIRKFAVARNVLNLLQLASAPDTPVATSRRRASTGLPENLFLESPIKRAVRAESQTARTAPSRHALASVPGWAAPCSVSRATFHPVCVPGNFAGTQHCGRWQCNLQILAPTLQLLSLSLRLDRDILIRYGVGRPHCPVGRPWSGSW